MGFSDSSYPELTPNQVSEAMFWHIDDKGNHFHILSKIPDNKSDSNAILISDGIIKSRNVNSVPNKTTAGWKLQVEYNDGSISWDPLKGLKASNLPELAKQTINNKIEHKLAFRC